MEGILIRMVLSLGAVLALMVGLMYLVKRFVLPGTAATGLPVKVEVIGRKSIQPKKSVVVVRVADKVLVLGVSDTGMQTLTELSEEALQASQAVPVRPAATPHIPFSAYLQETLRTMRRRQNSEVGA
jgi:flagellar protein FliO/FliZ